MPKYILPKFKVKKEKAHPASPDIDLDWIRNVSITVNQEIIDALSIDDQVVVKLVGKIQELVGARSPNHSNYSLRLDVDSVEVYSQEDNEYSKMADELDKEGE